jgi:uncharacterized membrane protein
MDTATQQYSKHVSVPSNEGVRVDKSIVIHRPIVDVYRFWSHLENLPRFMHRLRSVTVKDHLHSHWVAQPIAGKNLEWDAEMIEQRENEMISWRSAPGADVDNAGSVWFTSMPGGQTTQVRVEMKYVPPGGMAGAIVAKATARDPGSELEEDLQRLKSLLETGTLPNPRNQNGSGLNRAAEAGRKTARAAQEYIRQNPWRAMGTIVITGFALGLILGLSLRSAESEPTALARTRMKRRLMNQFGGSTRCRRTT